MGIRKDEVIIKGGKISQKSKFSGREEQLKLQCADCCFSYIYLFI